MTVRDPGFDPRRDPRRRNARARPSASPIRWLGPTLVVVALLVVVIGALGGGPFGGLLAGAAAPTASGGSAATLPSASPSTAAVASPGATAPASSEPAATPAPTAGLAELAIVPVTNFRSPKDAIGRADLQSLVAGTSSFKALVLVRDDADGILGAIGLAASDLGSRLVRVRTPAALAANLASHRDRLGFLRADQVGASVRALGWGSRQLFGVTHVASLAKWPLRATLATGGAAGTPGVAYDPAKAWTLVAGGDILLDRGVSLAIKGSARGANYPFDGGTVEITGHCKDCSAFGWDLPYTHRTGNGGAMRDLLRSADLTIANFENPAPNDFRFHASGTVFSANPAYLKGLRSAGIDWVSIANNHIGDAGRNGILQTIANLDRAHLAHSGAGRNATQAHKAALLKRGNVTVGLLAYDSIARVYNADSNTAGSARFTASGVKRDVRAARKAGADVVIVFPHWGVEYNPKPFAGEQRLAHAAIDAGADLVIGNHAHWAGAMEVYKGRPIWYALGNFVFDQTWSEPTMEGITLELTFNGTTLVQARLHPHLILGKAQPNFLDPAGDGKVVLSQVFRASKGLLDW